MIRRLEVADAQTVHGFLAKLYDEDPETGGVAALPVHRLENRARKGEDFWLAIEKGELIGLLATHGRGIRRSKEAIGVKEETFTLFDLLAIDHALYSASRPDGIRIARELTLFAADDLTARGRAPDYIYVTGLTGSRGASWCRLLEMEETAHPEGWSEFWLPFKDIWEKAKATEKL